jgi:sulfonate transport system ATP-binding protein
MTLEFRHVCKTFTVNQKPMMALDNISLTLAPGELVAIIGASGCGKSTLLRLAAGLERAEQGMITVNGHPVRGIRRR